MKPFKFYLATGNLHKLEELKNIFDPNLITLMAPPQKVSVIESGKSFEENALLKAKAYFSALKAPVLSDDSGLVLKAFPLDLGIYSARFGGENLTDQERSLLLLKKNEKSRGSRQGGHLCLFSLRLLLP